MSKKMVLDLFKKGFSIDYIINHIYNYENNNFLNYEINNGQLIFKNGYVSKNIVKNFVYRVLCDKCLL